MLRNLVESKLILAVFCRDQIKHTDTGRDLLPDQITEFLANLKPRLSIEERSRVTDPTGLSSWLSYHKGNENYLYCHLTRRQVKNDLHHARLHIDGKLFKHRFYEWKRRKLAR